MNAEKKAGSSVAGGILLLILTAFLLPIPEQWTACPWVGALFNGSHAVLFGLATVAMKTLLPRPWSPRARLGLAAGLVAAAAVLVEFLQVVVGRSASPGDVLAGWAGIALGAAAMRCRAMGWRAVCTAAIVLVALSPLARVHWELRCLRLSLPCLGCAGGNWSRFWIAQGASRLTPVLREGRRVLRVEMGEGSWEGVSFRPGSQDWRGFHFLRLEISNPGSPFQLGIRIDDRVPASPHGERYNGAWNVATGPNVVDLNLDDVRSGPASRLLDLHRIRRLSLFTGEHEPARVFYLENAILH